MKKEKLDKVDRRSVMSGLGVAALAGAALGSTSASAQTSSNKFEPKRHTLDDWMTEIPGVHRVFIDTSDAAGGANAPRYCSNILNAHINEYEGSLDEMAMIICYRHASTPFGFNDAMWEKYGDSFANFTQQRGPDGEAPKTNTLLSSINELAEKGVHFAICNTATKLTSRMLAGPAGLDADEVYAELIANAIPNAHFVPAGVMAVTRAQEHGYSLLYSAA